MSPLFADWGRLGRKTGMMAGGAALVGGAAAMAHRHRQMARSSGGRAQSMPMPPGMPPCY